MRTVLGALLAMISMSAAAVEMMEWVDKPQPPSPDEALVVFVYPADSGEFVRMSIIDVTDPAARLVGIIEPGSKVLHRAKPGQYLFMLNYARAHFLQADLAAGKTYYAVVLKEIPQGRFSVMNLYTLRAIRESELSNLLFVRAERNAMPVTKSKKADDWFAARATSFTQKKDKYLPVWREMSQDERAKSTLQQSDGR